MEGHEQLGFGQPVARFEPEAPPGLGVVELGFGMLTAPGDEAGEVVSAGWLTDGVVAEVHADPHVLTLVRERRVGSLLVHEERTAPLDRLGNRAVDVEDAIR